MNKDEIRARYLNAIEPRIQGFEDSLAGDPRFDALVNMDKQFVYELYHPVMQNADYRHFNDICELYNSIQYEIEDDGCLSLVHSKYKSTVIPTEYEAILNTCFVLRGYPDELKIWDVQKQIKKLNSNFTHVVSSNACIFNWESFSYIVNLNKLYVDANQYGDDAEKYYACMHEIDDLILHHIKDSKHHVRIKPQKKF